MHGHAFASLIKFMTSMKWTSV